MSTISLSLRSCLVAGRPIIGSMPFGRSTRNSATSEGPLDLSISLQASITTSFLDMLDESSDQESESECNSPAESDIDQELSMEYFCGLTLEMQTMFAEADSLEPSTCFAIYTKILAVLLATSKRAASFAASVGQTFSSIFPAIFTTFYTMAHSVVWATQTIYTALLTCFEAIFTVFIIYKLIRQLTWRLNDHKGKRTIMGAVHAMLSKFLRAFVMHVAARVLVLVLVLVAAGLGVVWMVHCV